MSVCKKILAGVLLLSALCQVLGADEVFLNKEAASKFLSRGKRSLQEECYSETCSFEEIREVHGRGAYAQAYWKRLTGQCEYFKHCNPAGTLQCVNKYRGYTCRCNPGYSGTTCHVYNACATSPCSNGRCVSTSNSFQCTCNTGWIGKRCQYRESDCIKKKFCPASGCDKAGRLLCLCAKDFDESVCRLLQTLGLISRVVE